MSQPISEARIADLREKLSRPGMRRIAAIPSPEEVTAMLDEIEASRRRLASDDAYYLGLCGLTRAELEQRIADVEAGNGVPHEEAMRQIREEISQMSHGAAYSFRAIEDALPDNTIPGASQWSSRNVPSDPPSVASPLSESSTPTPASRPHE